MILPSRRGTPVVVAHFGRNSRVEFRELDPRATIESQLGDMEGPVVLLNVFIVAVEDSAAFLKAWSAESDFSKTQPGYISTQLHQGRTAPRCM